MHRNSLATILLIVATIAISRVYAWDTPGHETVAAIAWDSLQPATRTKVTAILKGAQAGDCLSELQTGDDRAFFIRAATWPDVVRNVQTKDLNGKPLKKPLDCTHFNEPGEHFNDHFWAGTSDKTGTDAPHDRPDVAKSPKNEPKQTHNAVERLTSFTPLVACKTPPCKVTPVERANDLAWLLHLAGDVHQPLHNAARVTADAPDGDEGGNLFPLKPDQTTPPKLHGFWDDIIDRSTPRNPGEEEIAYIDRLAKGIMQKHSQQSLAARIESGQFSTWSAEGFATAEKLAYPSTLKPETKPSAAYRNAVLTTGEEAVALAGYRLADLLDSMLK